MGHAATSKALIIENVTGPRNDITYVSKKFVFFFFFFKQKTAYEFGLGIPAEPLFRSILKRRGCLTVPRLTLMSLIKMMLVMVSVAAISKTFGLLRFLLRLSFLAK